MSDEELFDARWRRIQQSAHPNYYLPSEHIIAREHFLAGLAEGRKQAAKECVAICDHLPTYRPPQKEQHED